MSVKISELTALTGANSATNDEYVVVDKDVPQTKKQTRAELFKSMPDGSWVNGNLGVGQSTPTDRLHVTGTVAAGLVRTYIENLSATGLSGFILALPNVGGGQFGGVTCNGASSFTNFFSTTAAIFATGASYTERMRITSAGNVGIGTSSPDTLCHINGTIRYTNRPSAGTITAIGYDTNGDLRNSSSSLRYKHGVVDYDKGLAEVMDLRPVVFKFNGEERENIGFIAEEIDALGLTEVMLYDEENRPDGVLYANMVALLTKALQEANAKIDALTARVEDLEASP
jgi:hypothetical protein